MNYKIILLIFLCNQSYSQPKETYLSTLDYVNIADSLASSNSYDLAADYYSLAMEDHLEVDLNSWYSTFGKFRINRYKGQNDLKIINEITEFLGELESNQFELRGKMLFYLGYYNSNLGFGSSAIIEYKKAIEEFHKIQNADERALKFLLSAYQNVAINYSRLGDQKSAIKFIQRAFILIDKMSDKSMLCGFYLNYSKFLFYDEHYIEMKRILGLALNECNSNFIKSYALDYLAEVYILQDSLELARFYLDKSYILNKNKHYQYYEIEGNYYAKMKNYTEAKNQYRIALKKLEEHVSKRSYRKSLTEYAEFLFSLNEKEEAINYAHRSLRNYYRGLDSLDYTDRCAIDDYLPDIWIIEALYIKAKYFREKFIKTKDEFSLKEATFYYNLLLAHFDKLKSKYYSSSSQYRMGAYSQKIYSEVISFYVEQYNKSKKNGDIENAFSLAQRANSFVLKNAISDRKALELARVSQDSLEQYLHLSSRVASDFVKDSTNGAHVLFEFDAFKESLVSNYPLYNNFEREEEISLAGIQSNLREKTLMIKYYYFNEVLTVFGISKHNCFAENISFSREMGHMINTNMDILSHNVSNDSILNIYLHNSKEIFDLIIGNFVNKYYFNEIDHLIIIPDGPLKKVAFNALAINKSKNWNDPYTYLLSKYSVNYLYYCSQLKKDNPSTNSRNGYIGFGIEYDEDFLKEIINDYTSNFNVKENDSRAISLSSLKYADDEVFATAEILNGTSYVNTDVTPSKVISLINNFDVIHFSTHAFVDELDYLNSFLVLNRDENDNYQLKYADILSFDVNSDMVVLSACQTSSGKSVAGEGLMSLSRAFVQSGSKSAVGSYWNAPDYATKELMTLFYINLKNGMSKSKALQQAQLEFLTNDKLSSPTIRSPFFWASWAVYGTNDSIALENSYQVYSIWKSSLILGIIGIVVCILMKIYRKKLKTSMESY